MNVSYFILVKSNIIQQLVSNLILQDSSLQLRQVALLVAGIRIFNWDSKRTGGSERASRAGGAGIEDLPTILNNAAEASFKNIDSLVQATADKIHRLTSLMEKLLYTEAGSKVD